MNDKFFEFGRKPALELIRTLFYAGTIPVLYVCYQFGKIFALMHPIQGMTVQQGGFYQGVERPGWILGVIVGGAALVILVILVILWKMVCEMLLIALRYFERGTGGAYDYKKGKEPKLRRKRL